MVQYMFVPFTYPRDLYTTLQKKWNKKISWEKTPPQLPPQKILEELIDVIYHASFLTEESRRLWFRVVFIEPKNAIETRGGRDTTAILFEEPREFSVGEVIKLTPAANPTQVLIGVHTNPSHSDKLQIWGLIESGNSWWDFVRHESNHGSPPPPGFTISSKEPGQVTISREGIVLLVLKQGKLSEPSEGVLYKGPVHDFLMNGAKALYKECCEELKIKKWSKEDNDWPLRFYTFFIERLLIKIRDLHHGGALIILPDELNVHDTRLTDRLNIKYRCEYNKSWTYLVKELIRHKQYYDLHFKFFKQTTISSAEYKAVSHLSYIEEYSEEYIANAIGFLSSLSGVDGAVVITDKLRLIGFGAEVTASSPSLKQIKIMNNVTENKREYKNIELFGTRHRSSFRFCSSFENAIVFIVSQDGDIKVTKRVDSEVVFWPDLRIDSMGF